MLNSSNSTRIIYIMQAERGASARVVSIGGKFFEEQEQQWRQNADQYIDNFDFSRIQNMPEELNSKDKFKDYLQNFRQEVIRNEISKILSYLLYHRPPRPVIIIVSLILFGGGVGREVPHDHWTSLYTPWACSKFVHYEAHTVGKWVVHILLECFLVTAGQRSCGKVMFPQVSVILLRWGGYMFPVVTTR